jgi:hypothetical protein
MATGTGTQTDPFRWSFAMNSLFNAEVNALVMPHRTEANGKSALFGIDFDVVVKEVIQLGLADFGEPYRSGSAVITPEQRVQCYCFANMKGHFWADYAHFRSWESSFEPHFSGENRLVIIDVGCGPATAGLAFSELFPGQAFAYYGIDRVAQMRGAARQMMRQGQVQGVVDDETTTVCRSSWEQLPSDLAVGAVVLLNFSFFFGSPWLTPEEIQSLAKFYHHLASTDRVNSVLISYTNSPHDLANKKYATLLRALNCDPTSDPPKLRAVSYHKKLRGADTGRTSFLSEIFWV